MMEDSLLTTILNQVFGWVVLTVLLSWISAIGYPLISRTLVKKEAGQSALFSLLYGLLAPAATTVTMILLSLPALSFIFVIDHCHATHCAPHTVHMQKETIKGAMLVSLILVLLLCVSVIMLMQLLKSRQKLKLLGQLSKKSTAAFRIVDSPAHLAWCVGLIRPQIYLSSGLIDALSPKQIEAVLAHELAHVVRKDNLRKWLLHWATFVWPSRFKHQIRRDLAHYIEQICDVMAAKVNSLAVVDTLERYDSLTKSGFNSSEPSYLESRREKLEQELNIHCGQKAAPLVYRLQSIGIMMFLGGAAIILSVHFGHHLLEWLLR
ncbi:M56 family metallopeptidase [Marinibactrum halimedae]|uniref:Peptidase M48 domain-containing protein n=1 Tax=Marinibactrum halimedae TaxID=1444977 RepID=A0AA37T3J6_9GAMM|nr:M56 family metallopeptidase [Marinibactrum halimedae]MCD9457830.1 M56 family metallopeptidase [Marinibactrum halimedae]GLS24796.1 hypothetical protein GCM10007877_05100 [Marinibactrum halimedae]